MKKLESSLSNMLLVLVGFSVVIGALLAYVNHLTQGEIEKKKAAQPQAGIVSVMGNSSIKVTKTDSVNEVIDGKTADFVIHNISDAQGQPLGLCRRKRHIRLWRSFESACRLRRHG